MVSKIVEYSVQPPPPGYSFGYRFDSKHQSSNLPGVGQYDIKKAFEKKQKLNKNTDFDQQERFKPMKKIEPGPGSYEVSKGIEPRSYRNLTVQTDISPKHTKTRSAFDLKYVNPTGPGQYDNNQSCFDKGPKETRAMKIKNYSSRRDLQQNKDIVPPVGQYNIVIKNPAEMRSLPIPKSERALGDQKKMKIPGVGSYNIDSALTFVKDNKGVKMPLAKRFSDGVEEIFSPNENKEDRGALSSKYNDESSLYKFRSLPKFSFQKDRKNIVFRIQNENPSPNNYNIKYKPEAMKMIKIGDSKRQYFVQQTPGVGEYKIETEPIGGKVKTEANLMRVSQSIFQKTNSITSQTDINDKKLDLKKSQLLLQSSNIHQKEFIKMNTSNYTLEDLRKHNLPGPGQYSEEKGLLTLSQNQQKNKLMLSNRQDEYIDIFNLPKSCKQFIDRSPGPAAYSGELQQKKLKTQFTREKKPDVFYIPKHPGVGEYNISKSAFDKYLSKNQINKSKDLNNNQDQEDEIN